MQAIIFFVYTVFLLFQLSAAGKVEYRYYRYTVDISCEGVEALTRLNSVVTPKIVNINNCPTPNTTYLEALRNLNINIIALEAIEIKSDNLNDEYRDSHFDGFTANTSILIKKVIGYKDYTYKVRVDIITGKMNLSHGDSFEISCGSNYNKIRNIPGSIIPNVRLSFWLFIIDECEVTGEVGFIGALALANVDTTRITNLKLTFQDKYPPILNADLFTNMNIQTLISTGNVICSNCTAIDGKVFEENVKTLREIYFKGLCMPKVPELSNITKATLLYGKAVDSWGGCKKLQIMTLKKFAIPDLSNGIKGWLAHCNELIELSMSFMNPEDVMKIVAGVKSLQRLTVTDSKLNVIKETFLSDATQLEYLDLSYNSISQMDIEVFRSTPLIKTLNLAHNFELETVGWLMESFYYLTELSILILDEMPFLDVCSTLNFFMDPPPLEYLSLRSTGLSRLCFSDFNGLQNLDVSSNRITTLQLSELPKSRSHAVYVDLKANPIDIIMPIFASESSCAELNSTDYFMEVVNVTVDVIVSVSCDCEHACLARVLRRRRGLWLRGAVCRDGRPLDSRLPAHVEALECDKYQCGDCTCRRQWSSGTVQAWCEALGLRALPARLHQEPALVAIHSRANNIHQLPDNLPLSVSYLDLRDNGIVRATAAAAAALFANPNRSISLSGSTVDCECDEDSRSWVTKLIDNSAKVTDFVNLICSDPTLGYLKDLDIENLCAEPLPLWPIISALALIATVSITFLFSYLRYQRQIKVFLFAHGLCLSCVQEQDADPDKEYDAFISFCHEDDEFVTEEIIPKLSEYRLCVHYRDWMAGGWIPAQIARSIDLSRRTIIVMSRSFLRSQWGLMEFRMAHASTAEGGARVIVMIREDIFDAPELDAELRSYLATNTYVKWGDPWFFDKLRYAMPRQTRQEVAADATEHFRMAAITYRRDGDAHTASVEST